MHPTHPFHEGELAVQGRAGVGDAALQTGRIIQDRLPAGAGDFIRGMAMVFCASLDEQGDVWASMVQGTPGFLRAPDPHTLEITADPARADGEDPLWANIRRDRRIGLLFIDLETRRRLRVNGVARLHGDRLEVSVRASYPNCPKYIQRRRAGGAWVESAHEPVREGHTLTADLVRTLRATDTFFVASAHPQAGADVSHRGGPPGFVQVIDGKTLRIPDYAGNNLFNTLGNFHASPRAGILLPDFGSGRIIQAVGVPHIEWGATHPQQATGGTHRYWRLHIARWRTATLPQHLALRLIDYSPYLPADDTPNGA